MSFSGSVSGFESGRGPRIRSLGAPANSHESRDVTVTERHERVALHSVAGLGGHAVGRDSNGNYEQVYRDCPHRDDQDSHGA